MIGRQLQSSVLLTDWLAPTWCARIRCDMDYCCHHFISMLKNDSISLIISVQLLTLDLISDVGSFSVDDSFTYDQVSTIEMSNSDRLVSFMQPCKWLHYENGKNNTSWTRYWWFIWLWLLQLIDEHIFFSLLISYFVLFYYDFFSLGNVNLSSWLIWNWNRELFQLDWIRLNGWMAHSMCRMWERHFPTMIMIKKKKDNLEIIHMDDSSSNNKSKKRKPQEIFTQSATAGVASNFSVVCIQIFNFFFKKELFIYLFSY